MQSESFLSSPVQNVNTAGEISVNFFLLCWTLRKLRDLRQSWCCTYVSKSLEPYRILSFCFCQTSCSSYFVSLISEMGPACLPLKNDLRVPLWVKLNICLYISLVIECRHWFNMIKLSNKTLAFLVMIMATFFALYLWFSVWY